MVHADMSSLSFSLCLCVLCSYQHTSVLIKNKMSRCRRCWFCFIRDCRLRKGAAAITPPPRRSISPSWNTSFLSHHRSLSSTCNLHQETTTASLTFPHICQWQSGWRMARGKNMRNRGLSEFSLVLCWQQVCVVWLCAYLHALSSSFASSFLQPLCPSPSSPPSWPALLHCAFGLVLAA